MKEISIRQRITFVIACLGLAALANGKEFDITVDGDSTKPGYNHAHHDGRMGNVIVNQNDTVVWTCGDKCKSMTITFPASPCDGGSTFSSGSITCKIVDTTIVVPDKYTIQVTRTDNTTTQPDDPYVIVDNQGRPPKKPTKP